MPGISQSSKDRQLPKINQPSNKTITTPSDRQMITDHLISTRVMKMRMRRRRRLRNQNNIKTKATAENLWHAKNVGPKSERTASPTTEWPISSKMTQTQRTSKSKCRLTWLRRMWTENSSASAKWIRLWSSVYNLKCRWKIDARIVERGTVVTVIAKGKGIQWRRETLNKKSAR